MGNEKMIEAKLRNAEAQFKTNGAVWDARTEAAVKSLIGSHVLDVEWLTMPADVVNEMRYAIRDSYSTLEEATVWLNARYDKDGKPID